MKWMGRNPAEGIILTLQTAGDQGQGSKTGRGFNEKRGKYHFGKLPGPFEPISPWFRQGRCHASNLLRREGENQIPPDCKITIYKSAEYLHRPHPFGFLPVFPGPLLLTNPKTGNLCCNLRETALNASY